MVSTCVCGIEPLSLINHVISSVLRLVKNFEVVIVLICLESCSIEFRLGHEYMHNCFILFYVFDDRPKFWLFFQGGFISILWHVINNYTRYKN